MIVDVGNIIIEKIQDLPFVDKITGVVRVITMKDEGSAKKVFPVACNMDLADCNKGKRYLDFCPDSSKKSVLYLEESGLRPTNRVGFQTYWKGSYNLVCWLNLPKLGVTSDCSYSAIAIGGILNKLTIPQFNSGNYSRVEINIVGQQPKNQNPFTKYSYDEVVNQFMMYPYDHFVLAVDVDFMIDARCVTIPSLSPEATCIKK